METILGLALVLAIVLVVVWAVLYRWGGVKPSGPAPAGADEPGDFLVRTYRGRAQADVVGTYVADARSLAARGYEPVSQSWGDGAWDLGFFLIALLLCLFGIGILLLAYMAIVKPDGTLLVTYRLGST